MGLLDSGIYSALAMRGPGRSLILSTLCKSFEQVEFYEEEAFVISTLTVVFQKWNSLLNRGISLFREPRAPSPNPAQVDEFVNPVLGLPSR